MSDAASNPSAPPVPDAKRPGRPAGVNNRTVGERMADAADRLLLSWMRHGVTVEAIDAEGNAITAKKPMSAAHMQCVLKRLHQIGAAHRKFDQHNSARDLVAKARLKFQGKFTRGGGAS